MRFSKAGAGFALLSVVMFVILVLLTPLSGLETRDPAKVHPIGLFTLILIFVAGAFNAVAIALLRRRPRVSVLLGGLGIFLVLPSVVLDQTGQFSTLAAPAAIRVLEFAMIAVEALLLLASIWLWSETQKAEVGGQAPERTLPPRG